MTAHLVARGTRRRWAVLVVAAALLAPVAGSAGAAVPTDTGSLVRITAERRVAPRVLELTIATPAFAAPTHVTVDLPVGYGQDPARRWPVTYYLAGTNHHHQDFNEQYGGVALSAGYPSLVVSPNGDAGYWSDWVDTSAGRHDYETFVVDQLVPLVDRRFHTRPTRAARAIMGESMGGYGATMLAARHPDVFSAVSSLSGAVDSNLPANGAVLSASPMLQGGAPDAVYGPRSTQEVRWRGHNPVDLAANLRTLDVQVRSAAGVVDPSIGEGPVDASGCAVEAAVDMATTDLHAALQAAGVSHAYTRYPTGCHSVPNFQRQIAATFRVFARRLQSGSPTPTSFTYRAVEPALDVFGWSVRADPARALEFLELRTTGRGVFSLTGSGRTSVTTARLFRPGTHVRVTGATPARAVADRSGRVRVSVDLGPADRTQQYTAGSTTTARTRAVRVVAE